MSLARNLYEAIMCAKHMLKNITSASANTEGRTALIAGFIREEL
jgi:hypothetical protein